MKRSKRNPNNKKTNELRQSNRAASLYLHYKGEIFKMAKIGSQKKVTVEGVEYTLQFPGHREQVRIQDRCTTDRGTFSSEKMAEELFKHVIVDPKVDWEYFDGNEEKGIEPKDGFNELFTAASTFLRDGK
ncbi:hypothetical protein [Priestia aryabhattai]|uniref:hypothetical protein n=1 Tax=Priestia aryabhattai TaxID=412384 RepID=UPI002E1CF5E8|nr:hypothetical protein [Priestia aryabhattai]MED4257691.1 hypothetical protein [Priestia aryabhattai]